MVEVSKAAWQAMVDRLFVVNLTGDIEADECETLFINLSDSVVFNAPSTLEIQSFRLVGLGPTVDQNTTLSGTVSIIYHLNDAALAVGTGTVRQNGVAIATGLNPAGTTAQITITNVTLSAGQSETFRLEFTNTASQVIGVDYVVTARQPQEHVYVGIQTTPNIADFDIAASTTNDFGFIANRQTVTLPTFTGNHPIVIAQPASEPAITELIIDSINQRDAFTLTQNAFLVNAVQYNAYVSAHVQIGTIVSGESVEIVR